MGALPHSLTLGRRTRSVYEDREVIEAADDDWRAEQLRATGIGYGWRPLDQFVWDRQ